MSVKAIVTYPSPILRKKGAPVDLNGTRSNILQYLQDMEDTLDEVDKGAALAANQIGIELQMFVVNQALTADMGYERANRPWDPTVTGIPPYIINPVILKRSPETALLNEGCLSFPGFYMPVRRHKWVQVQYETILKIDGEWVKEFTRQATYEDFWAQVFQHEIDHLNGKLFVDALSEKKRLEVAAFIRKRK